jgi:rubrerythrin
METNGAEFYELAARSTRQTAARLMLHGLAAMENAHRAAFMSLKEQRGGDASATAPEVDAAVSGFLASWLDGEVFDKDKEKALAVARSGAMADVLRVAIQMEKDSIAFYTGLEKYVADDESEGTLNRIIKDELRHIADLNNAFRDLK